MFHDVCLPYFSFLKTWYSSRFTSPNYFICIFTILHHFTTYRIWRVILYYNHVSICFSFISLTVRFFDIVAGEDNFFSQQKIFYFQELCNVLTCTIQMCIQNLVNYLRWSFLRKKAVNYFCGMLLRKDRNTPLPFINLNLVVTSSESFWRLCLVEISSWEAMASIVFRFFFLVESKT